MLGMCFRNSCESETLIVLLNGKFEIGTYDKLRPIFSHSMLMLIKNKQLNATIFAHILH